MAKKTPFVDCEDARQSAKQSIFTERNTGSFRFLSPKSIPHSLTECRFYAIIRTSFFENQFLLLYEVENER